LKLFIGIQINGTHNSVTIVYQHVSHKY